MKAFKYGAVLKVQREFTLEDIKRSLESMKGIGMNTVVIWPAVFWWEDRTLAHYPFNTGRRILEMADELEMNIIMELEGQITCLEYMPDFVMRPEYFAVDADGHHLNKGTGYGYLNYSHPEVRMLLHKVFESAVSNYKDYSSLYGYDIYNETRFESFDSYTLQTFREWLKEKYGTIEALNDAWERTYYDWSQIQFSNWMWASVMPVVDYNQFKKFNMGRILREWSAVVKAIDPHHPTIADNVYASVSRDEHYVLPQDDWNVAESVDEFGISLYPKNDAVGLTPSQRWQTLSGVHSASREGRFWISELQSHNVAMFNPFSVVKPHYLRWWCWEAISHGAKGIIYWKWDPFTKGVQTMGRGLVDTRGNYTVRAHEVKAIADVLAGHEREFAEYDRELPKVAILYDQLNHDFTKAYSRNHGQKLSDSILLDSLTGMYEAFWEEGVAADYVIPRNVLSGEVNKYKALFITSQVNVTVELAAAIADFMAQGGLVVCDGRFGAVDNLGMVHTVMPLGTRNDVLGYTFEDIDPEDLNIRYTSLTSSEGNKDELELELELTGYYERQILAIYDSRVEVLGRFDNDDPAIIRTPHGKGAILTLATFMWYGYFMEKPKAVLDFVRQLADRYALRVHTSSRKELKLSSLRGKDGLLLFVTNYGKEDLMADIILGDLDSNSCTIKHLYEGKVQELAVEADGKLKFAFEISGQDVSVIKVSFAG
ncbi:hypothetical protein EHS13_27860 [Paenibacillus psychroresistens]|uniref:beta-galactosidase n=1 Tax=Paenibacillus psychroresistens TaxID=1778678 RepID=A0A6B8RR31_9BACL|nr:beta-galactosidase [Paenibacillus psychroresistens]QGQ98429.1 hypothetical protein EHS13_27860 [Paenibacillus psychroresistens]